MKAVRIHEHGGIDNIKWESVSDPEPRTGQVLIQIKAAALNHLDIWVRNGIPGVPLPCILGSDGAGKVVELGMGITDLSIGDRIMIQPLTYCGTCKHCSKGKENYCSDWGIFGENQDGTQCELMAIDKRHLRRIPEHINYEEAAAFSLVAQTAYTMLVRKANIQAGEIVFVWGAGSGVGTMAIQIAKSKGCFVIAAGGSKQKRELAHLLGADHTIDYHNENVIESVKEITGKMGVDVVFEHVGAETWKTSMAVLGVGGRLVTCGATTGPKVDLDIRHLFYKQQAILGSTMGDVAAFDEVLSLLTEQKIKPVLDRVFPMKDVQDAHRYLESGKQLGKIILSP